MRSAFRVRDFPVEGRGRAVRDGLIRFPLVAYRESRDTEGIVDDCPCGVVMKGTSSESIAVSTEQLLQLLRVESLQVCARASAEHLATVDARFILG